MSSSRRSLAAVIPLCVAFTGESLAGQQSGSMPIAQEFESLHVRSIGPATMSGRVSDLAVYEAKPSIYYVGTAHGGVWKTTSNGAIFTPLFQHEGLISIGDVTVSQSNPNLLWVGAGESNNRQTSSFGGGVYKSTNGGESFQLMGLPESRAINRIVIDPTNNDVVLVAATGSLFGPGGDRGVYKTTDGGRTWKRVLNVDENTGANDLVMSAMDSKILYASTYQRRRTARGMTGTGPGSGIWKSTDGGDTWTRLTGGLPTGPLGRIGLDVYRKNSNLVYAQIEGGGGGRGGVVADPDDSSATGRGGRGGGGRGAGGRGGAGGGANATGLYRSDDGGQSWRRITAVNPRPSYFSQVRIDPNNPDRIYMGGVGLHMSLDGGQTFETDAALVTHDDIHAIWIDPNDSDHIMLGNDGGIVVSYDMSKTWTFIPNLPVGLFYHVAYDMERPFNVCGGMQDNYNWCGPSASRFTRGIISTDWFQILGGDGFVSIPDLRDSRIIYTESQNGNMIRRNKVTGESKSIRPVAENVVNAQPGDGAYRWSWDTPLVLSGNDPGVLLSAANRVFRSTNRGDTWTAISADLTNGGTLVSLAESPKQAGLVYTGSDDAVVSVTRDGGHTWQNITKNLPGISAIAYISEVVPSRFDAGTVYVTVDGHWENDYEPHIWASTNFGATFHAINGNLRGENVRTLTEDTRNPDVLYIGTETGVFLTLDRGRSWRRLKLNMPTVRVDELTIHSRDNALLIATHGRALWILDHLEPIQEYAAVQSAPGDATLFSVPTALQWKSKHDRNDEFWGHQTFIGENPPTEAVIQFNLKRPVTNPMLRITGAAGVKVRDLAIPASRNNAGIQTVCWDQRVQPIAALVDSAMGAGAGARGSGGGGAGGRGGAAGGAGARGGGGPVTGIPVPLPVSGYLPENPCGGGGGGGGSGGGGGRGGGSTATGPYVMPGTYQVALIVNGAIVDTKPMRIVMDPLVPFTDAARRRYNDILMDLHDMQRRGTDVAAILSLFRAEVATVAPKVEASSAPASIRAQFAAFAKEFDGVRTRFGVGGGGDSADAGGRGGARGGAGRGGTGRGGGRGGRGGGADENVLGRAATLKGAIMGFWEMPSDALLKQYADVKVALPAAIADGNAFLVKARAMSLTLQRYNVTMLVPSK